jgi:uncharacterized RDD family membrane protein YckC
VFCSKCGATITGDASFCQSCGTPVSRGALAIPQGGVVAVSPHSGVGAIAYISSPVYAGFWLRFVAYLIDNVILGIFGIVLSIPFFFLIGGAALIETLPRHRVDRLEPEQMGAFITMLILASGLWTLIQWLYFAYLESGEKQGTWGKQMLGIYVTDLEGNRISFGRASGRFFAKIVSGLIPFGLGYIMAGFTERKQALHDMIASCLVLRR